MLRLRTEPLVLRGLRMSTTKTGILGSPTRLSAMDAMRHWVNLIDARNDHAASGIRGVSVPELLYSEYFADENKNF